MYYVKQIIGAAVVLVGLLMVINSMQHQNTYWLIFGLAVMFGAVRQLEKGEDR